MSKAAADSKRELKQALRASVQDLQRFDMRTNCENAVWEIKRGLQALEIIWEAAEYSPAFDTPTGAGAVLFIGNSLRSQVEKIEIALGFKATVGGADV
jgi:hypothetical protein